MVPGAGLEPARLAAGDFESQGGLKLGVGYRSIVAAQFSYFMLPASLGVLHDAAAV